jgi:hypothetical protein
MTFQKPVLALGLAFALSLSALSGGATFADDKERKYKEARSTGLVPNHAPAPAMPRKAIEHQTEGYVVLKFTVLPDGSVDMNTVETLLEAPKGYHFAGQARRVLRYFIYDRQEAAIAGVTYKFDFELAF